MPYPTLLQLVVSTRLLSTRFGAFVVEIRASLSRRWDSSFPKTDASFSLSRRPLDTHSTASDVIDVQINSLD